MHKKELYEHVPIENIVESMCNGNAGAKHVHNIHNSVAAVSILDTTLVVQCPGNNITQDDSLISAAWK